MLYLFGQWQGDVGDVHPDDRKAMERDHPLYPFDWGTNNGVGVFEITRWDGVYLHVRVEGATYRVRGTSFRPFPVPTFGIGAPVRTTNGTPRAGWIASIGWHFLREEPTYYLEVPTPDGAHRRLKRRYFGADLEPVSSADPD